MACGLTVVYYFQNNDDCFNSCVNSFIEKINQQKLTNKIDLFLTSAWPKFICNKSAISNEDILNLSNNGSYVVSYIIKEICPKYILTNTLSGIFFERLPFRNHLIHKETPKQVTRFICIGSISNKTKQKSFYAVNICPYSEFSQKSTNIEIPINTTENPFNEIDFRQMMHKTNQNEQNKRSYFFQESEEHEKKKDNDYSQKTKQPKYNTSSCWFCLSSKNLEEHLIVDVGEHCYLAMAKGPLNEKHLLICPIDHIHCFGALKHEVKDDISKLKTKLRSFYQSLSFKCVFFERNFQCQHFQIQCVPICNTFEDSYIKNKVIEVFNNLKMAIDENSNDSDFLLNRIDSDPYFHMELNDGSQLLHRIFNGISVNIGRQILIEAGIVNVDSRYINWKNCCLPKDIETEQTDSLREIYSKFSLQYAS